MARTIIFVLLLVAGEIATISAQSERDQTGPPVDGDNGVSIRVIDKTTGKPIAKYGIRAMVVLPNDPMPQGLDRNFVTGPDGVTRIDGLGEITLRFYVHATGYEGQSKRVAVRSARQELIFELMPGGTIKGRLIDSVGVPVADARLRINPTRIVGDRHMGFNEFADTNEKGEFLFEELPAGAFQLECLSFGRSIGEEMDRINRAISQQTGRWQPYSRERVRRLRAEMLNQPLRLAPIVAPIEVHANKISDVGTIRLEAAPILELEIFLEGGRRLPDFPFSVGASENGRTVDSFRWQTDEDGRAQVPLVSWRRGRDFYVIVPPPGMNEVGQIPELMAKRPDPTAGLDLRRYYDIYIKYQGIQNEDEPVEFENLSRERIAEVTKKWEQEKKSLKEREARDAALPAYKTYVLFDAAPGKVSRVRVDYTPTSDTLDLALTFRDKLTKLPIRKITGAIAELDSNTHHLFGVERTLDGVPNDKVRGFHADDPQGLVLIPALQLSQNFRQKLSAVDGASSRANADPQMMARYKHELAWKVTVEAPGYTRQGFHLDYARAQAGKELVFELEPEARVRGRVVLANTGEPLTSATLWEIASKQADRDQRFPQIVEARVSLDNPLVEPGQLSWTEARTFQTHASVVPDTAGNFEIGALKPDENWVLGIGTEKVLPTYSRAPIILRAGMNDLGTIKVGKSGVLSGRISDEQGRPLQGAAVSIFQSEILADARIRTTTAGLYQASLKSVLADNTVVRLNPPWGRTEFGSSTGTLVSDIGFDAIVTLDRSAETTLSAQLRRGNLLRVVIPPSLVRNQAFAHLADKSGWEGELSIPARGRNDTREFRPGFIALEATEPNPDGFTYHQSSFMSGAKIPATSEPLVLEVENVPPGPMAVRLNGQAFNFPAGYPVMALQSLAPLAFGEFEMPATSHTVTLAVNSVDVEFELTERPPIKPGEEYSTLLLFDRIEPVSTFHGGDLQRMMTEIARSSPRAAADYQTSMVGYYAFFMSMNSGGRGTHYQPVLFRFVPSGEYRLRLFAQLNDATASPSRPYYDETITVPEGGGKMKFDVPWKGVQSAAPPTPVEP